jgi:hypothetical protein
MMLEINDNVYCYICFKITDKYLLCDMCDKYYCEDCSYRFSLHYQHQGARCYECADQDRIKPLRKIDIRNNKIESFIGKKISNING